MEKYPSASESLLDEVVQLLLKFDVPLVDAPTHVLECLQRALHPQELQLLTPAWLRQFLRRLTQGKASFPLRGSKVCA